MHVNSFNANVENGALAEKMGVVIGTSHCDMLMRSNNREWEPWKRKKGYNDLVYDFSIEGENREKLLEYWRESIEQNHDFEVTYTLGMRGIHDSGFNAKALEGLTGDTLLKARIALLSDWLDRTIPHLGRGCGDLVELSDPSSTLTYELTLPAAGTYALTPIPAAQPLVPSRSSSPGCIRIRDADALRQTEQAHTIGAVPDSCSGIGRKDISLYFRSQDEIDYSNASIGNCSDTPNGGICSSQADNSGSQASALAGLSFPCVCYTVGTPAGNYTLWLCLYTKGMDEYCFNVAIDDVLLLPDAEASQSLWRYSSENVYKWIPLTSLNLTEDSHTIAFFFHKARLRLEGIVLQRE